jgi:Na+(H+)/acetate symporter ActP
MTGLQIAAVAAMAVVAVVTYSLGRRSSAPRGSQTFGTARRAVRSRRNAAAMSGEYLCAALFIGITGAVLAEGADAIWYPIGFTAGFFALLIFVAAPLRRSGAYTMPDFIDARLPAPRMRALSSVIAALIGVLYLVPQLQGAELAASTLLPVPGWAGPVALTALVLVNVLGGGMRAVTVTLAFQYWLKMFAIIAPTLVILAVFVGTKADDGGAGITGPAPPTFTEPTTVTVQTPVRLHVGAKTDVLVDGVIDGDRGGEETWTPELDHDVAAGTKLHFAAGAPVPVVAGQPAGNADWLTPGDGDVWQLLGIYSLLIALLLGTMGLPHILVRFYTNPDGTSARRTTLHVLLFVGLFAVFPTLLGVLSRLYVPELMITGDADAAVLLLPAAVVSGVGGQILTAVVVAGVFSAFLAAASGLVFSVAGVIATGVLPEKLRDVRVAAVLMAAVALGLALAAPRLDLAHAIGFAFALAASTFCPVLVLGIWWRGLTAKGAAAGMVVGALAVLSGLGLELVSGYTGSWAPVLVQHPALVSVPLAFLVTWVVSKASRGDIPATVDSMMLRMHAPDSLGFLRDKDIPRYGQAEEKVRLNPGRHRHRR